MAGDFERAECLIREQFPQFGEECEILAGTGWLEDESEAIDWVIRRPEKHVIASKIPFLKKNAQRPRQLDESVDIAETERRMDGTLYARQRTVSVSVYKRAFDNERARSALTRGRVRWW